MHQGASHYASKVRHLIESRKCPLFSKKRLILLFPQVA
jgi:hypothetical protein